MRIISNDRVEIKRTGCDAVMLMREILKFRHDADEEHIWSIGLNSQNKTLYVDKMGPSLRLTISNFPRRLFRTAIFKNATAVILCHKRLSENTKPSKEDVNITRRLSHTGETIGISFLDHVILGNTGYFSFREYGMNNLLCETKSIRKFSSGQQQIPQEGEEGHELYRFTGGVTGVGQRD